MEEELVLIVNVPATKVITVMIVVSKTAIVEVATKKEFVLKILVFANVTLDGEVLTVLNHNGLLDVKNAYQTWPTLIVMVSNVVTLGEFLVVVHPNLIVLKTQERTLIM
jgi:hypothetical protein